MFPLQTYVQIIGSQNLNFNLGIPCLEAGNQPLSSVMGYHCKTSFLSHQMVEDTSTLLLDVHLLRQWLTS
ncbi:hypothetical protein Ahy_B09g099035 [Arachis hypogaea]|uniref:Uncharacterized protein n=1 Tax=Arachis hypogaea TaxID=3818 RepID=A0A444XTK8_ARAHY|nr:hypothetical protein Ahy_B09g099035 [Arachis hypogaea]